MRDVRYAIWDVRCKYVMRDSGYVITDEGYSKNVIPAEAGIYIFKYHLQLRQDATNIRFF
jgi:hypothetical protein